MFGRKKEGALFKVLALQHSHFHLTLCMTEAATAQASNLEMLLGQRDQELRHLQLRLEETEEQLAGVCLLVCMCSLLLISRERNPNRDQELA